MTVDTRSFVSLRKFSRRIFVHIQRVCGPRLPRSISQEYKKLFSCWRWLQEHSPYFRRLPGSTVATRSCVSLWCFEGYFHVSYVKVFSDPSCAFHTWKSGLSSSPAYLAALVRCLCCLSCTVELDSSGRRLQEMFPHLAAWLTADTVHTPVADALQFYTVFQVKVDVGS